MATKQITVRDRMITEGLLRPDHCTWTLDDPEMDTWGTSCGELFVITCDTPSKHGMRYCCYCGGELVETTHEQRDL